MNDNDFDKIIREKLETSRVPKHLKSDLLRQTRAHPPRRFTSVRLRQVLSLGALAAIVMVSLVLSRFVTPPKHPDDFNLLRAELSGWLAEGGRSLDSAGSPPTALHFNSARPTTALGGLPVPTMLKGRRIVDCRILEWRGHKVGLLCFSEESKAFTGVIHVMVTTNKGLLAPPPSKPVLHMDDRGLTASWSEGEFTYVLAGPETESQLRDFLNQSG